MVSLDIAAMNLAMRQFLRIIRDSLCDFWFISTSNNVDQLQQSGSYIRMSHGCIWVEGLGLESFPNVYMIQQTKSAGGHWMHDYEYLNIEYHMYRMKQNDGKQCQKLNMK